MTALAAPETTRLAELERTIEAGLRTFVEVGAALAEIRDERLYREDFPTFEAYCAERWGFAASRARQLVAAAETVTTVTAAGLPAPENERQARELSPLNGDEAEIVAAWREAQDKAAEHGEKLTARTVRNAVRNRVERIEREAEAQELKRREITCADCDMTAKLGEVRHGWGGDGKWRCHDCIAKRRAEERRQREEWWDSLTDEERESRRQNAADWEAQRRLEGSWRAIGDPEGEGGVAEYLQRELDGLRETEGWRHPELVRLLGAEAAEVERIAGELREWAEQVTESRTASDD